MTLDDANMMAALAKANYSYAFKHMTEREKILLVHSWAFVLQDIPIETVLLAFFELISKRKWLPTLAEIREQVGLLHGEAEDWLRQTKFLEEVNSLREDIYSPESAQRIIRLQAIANEIYSQTDHFAQGLHGNENALTLSGILNAVESSNQLGGNKIIDLLIPSKTQRDLGANDKKEE